MNSTSRGRRRAVVNISEAGRHPVVLKKCAYVGHICHHFSMPSPCLTLFNWHFLLRRRQCACIPLCCTALSFGFYQLGHFPIYSLESAGIYKHVFVVILIIYIQKFEVSNFNLFSYLFEERN